MAVAAKGWFWNAAGAVALSLAGAHATAEPVSLRPHWKVGDERRYNLSAEYRQSAPGEPGQEAERRVTQTARLLIQVSEVDAAGGATIHLTFESLHTELAVPDGGTAEVFDWKAGDAAAPEPEGGPSSLARLSQALASCTMVAAVDPKGSITTLTGLAPLGAALKDEGGDTAALQGIGFFAPMRLKASLASLWRAEPEGRAREPGASWTTTEQVTLGETDEADETTAWTLVRIEGAVAEVKGVETLALSKSKREMDPSAPRLNIKNQAGTVTVDWDAASGLPVGRVEDRSVTWTATVDLGPGAATPQVSAESSAVSHVSITLVK